MDKRIIDGSSILGTALTLFAVGFILPNLWQSIVLWGACFYFLFLSVRVFWSKK
jgi:hypothetical protein